MLDSAYAGVADHVLSNTGGTLAPGRPDAVGTLTIDGGLAQSGAGAWEVDVESLTSFDVLAVSRASVLGGTIRVDGFDPTLALSLGDRFRVGTFAAGYAGTFSDVVSTDLFAGFRVGFSLAYNADNVELVVGSLAPIPEPSTWALWLAALAAAGALRGGRRSLTGG